MKTPKRGKLRLPKKSLQKLRRSSIKRKSDGVRLTKAILICPRLKEHRDMVSLLYQQGPHPGTRTLKTTFKYGLRLLNCIPQGSRSWPPSVVFLYIHPEATNHQAKLGGWRGMHSGIQSNLACVDPTMRCWSWAWKFPGRKIPGRGSPCNYSFSWTASAPSIR